MKLMKCYNVHSRYITTPHLFKRHYTCFKRAAVIHTKTPDPFIFLDYNQLHTLIHIHHINIYHSKMDGHVNLNMLKGQDIGALPFHPSVFMGY